MKSIILLNFCDGMYGGIESFLLNAFYSLDKSKFDVTFLTCGRTTYDMFKDDILLNGGHIDEISILPCGIKNKVSLFFRLKEYYINYQPDIVHINSGTLSLQLLASKAAKSAGVRTVILHSHNYLPNQTRLKEITKSFLKKVLRRYGDYFFACSKGAAQWMFPNEILDKGTALIIPNGIDTKKFLYDENKRNAFRKELGITDDELVIGNIGRFQGQKNHVFMIRIMLEVIKRKPDAKLLLLGEGILKGEIQKLVIDYSLQKNVFFLGERKDTDFFLSALDVFVFPSIYEGFGIAAIEAQAAGNRVIASNAVPSETNVTGNVVYLPINDSKDVVKWAEEICDTTRIVDRELENKKIYNAGYDVRSCYNKIIDIYSKE